jgi:hypothetical protein
VTIFIDELMVSANTESEHDEIVAKVMQRSQENNVKLKESKIQYKQKEVKYVGHTFNEQGMYPDPDCVKALRELRSPKTKKELQRRMVMFNYMCSFIPEFATISAPLRELFKNEVTFMWLPSHEKAYKALKEQIANAPVLVGFDRDKPIILQCDASKDGVGFCLLQGGSLFHLGPELCLNRRKSGLKLKKKC